MSEKQLTDVADEFGHCLRSEFTRKILDALIEKRWSLNIIGSKGSGKTRLLLDIQNSIPPETGCNYVNVNLKAYVNNYPGLLREIHRQLQREDEVPQRLAHLFPSAATSKESGPPAPFHILLMDNYDALLDNTKLDGKYDKDFFDDLNFIKNNSGISLLCTSSQPHNTLPVFIKGESFGNSWLTLEKRFLPDLTRRQVIAELKRQLDEYKHLWLKSNPDEKELLLERIHRASLPYPILCFLASKMNHQTYEDEKIKFSKRLKKWNKEFKKQAKYSVNKKLDNLKTSAEGVAIASGVNKLKIPIISDIILFIKKIRH